MSAEYEFPKLFTQMARDYQGGSMDPIYFAVLRMIDEDLIGVDEPEKDVAAERRNILRKK